MKITGKGKDENGNEVKVEECQLDPINNARWKGYLELVDRIEPLLVPHFEFSPDGKIRAAQWKSEESGISYEIDGQIEQSDDPKSLKREITLTIKDSNKEVYNFSGTIDILKTSIRGKCTPKSNLTEIFDFELNLN